MRHVLMLAVTIPAMTPAQPAMPGPNGEVGVATPPRPGESGYSIGPEAEWRPTFRGFLRSDYVPGPGDFGGRGSIPAPDGVKVDGIGVPDGSGVSMAFLSNNTSEPFTGWLDVVDLGP